MANAREVLIDSRDSLARVFVPRFEAAATAAIDARGRFACAVPGGSVASAFLPALVDAAVDWRRVDVFWADERAVPASDEASNFGLASRLWLQHVPLDPLHLHRLRAELPDLDAAASACADELAQRLGTPARLDVLLLGVGDDGHVASLFPGHPALDESERLVVAVRDAPKPPAARLTLTMPVLRAARAIYVAGFGPGKAAVIRAALEPQADPSRLPVAQVLRASTRVTVMLEE